MSALTFVFSILYRSGVFAILLESDSVKTLDENLDMIMSPVDSIGASSWHRVPRLAVGCCDLWRLKGDCVFRCRMDE